MVAGLAAQIFKRSVEIAAPAAVVWAFHERPDALELLTPPWMRVKVVQPPRSLAVGTRVVLRMWVGPLPLTIEAVHVAYEPGRMFADKVEGGPFAAWLHRHIVEPTEHGARLTDDITYSLRGGALGQLVAGRMVRRTLTRQFEYRHAVTRRVCEEEARGR
jgi:hypothetical protein